MTRCDIDTSYDVIVCVGETSLTNWRWWCSYVSDLIDLPVVYTIHIYLPVVFTYIYLPVLNDISLPVGCHQRQCDTADAINCNIVSVEGTTDPHYGQLINTQHNVWHDDIITTSADNEYKPRLQVKVKADSIVAWLVNHFQHTTKYK